MTYEEAEQIAKDHHHTSLWLAAEDEAFENAWRALGPAERTRWTAEAARLRAEDDRDLARRAPGKRGRIVVELDFDLRLPVESIARNLFRDAWTPPTRDESDAACDAAWLGLSEERRERDVADIMREERESS